MVTDDINQVDLWETYFSKAGERAKIFVHRAKSWIDPGTVYIKFMTELSRTNIQQAYII